jgi:hypothetical protein
MLIDYVHMCLLSAQYQKDNSTDNRMDVAQTYCQKIGRSKTPSIISTHSLMAVPILGQTQTVLVENMVLKSPMVYHALSSCSLLETVISWNFTTKSSFFPNENPNWSWKKTSLFHRKASSGSPRLANLRSILATATNGGDVVRGGAAFMQTGQRGGVC